MIVVCSQLGQLGVTVNNKADNVVVTVFLRHHSFTDESTIGLLDSSIEERNVSKLLTLDLSAKDQGVPIHKQHKNIIQDI